MPACPVCNSSLPILRYKLTFNVYHCKECGLQFCPDAEFKTSFDSDLNEVYRDKALKQLRKQNFQKVIELLKKHIDANQKGLEVGCGHGWFLETCKENGVKCEGIEPETRFNESYLSNGLTVTNGFYPQELKKGKFDFIVFNDVFEHLPDIKLIARNNIDILNDNGILAINLPIQEGLVYRFAKIAYRLGIKSPLNRMWQFNFHSPHLYYFTKKNLINLLTSHGFQLIETSRLKTINISDISNRIKQDKEIGLFRYLTSLVGVYCLYPFLQLFPDTFCFVFTKKKGL